MANVEERLQQLETQVDGVARLASAMAKGTGLEGWLYASVRGRSKRAFWTAHVSGKLGRKQPGWQRQRGVLRAVRRGLAMRAAGHRRSKCSCSQRWWNSWSGRVWVSRLKARCDTHRRRRLNLRVARNPKQRTVRPVIFTISFKGNVEGLAARGALDSQTVRDATYRGFCVGRSSQAWGTLKRRSRTRSPRGRAPRGKGRALRRLFKLTRRITSRLASGNSFGILFARLSSCSVPFGEGWQLLN